MTTKPADNGAPGVRRVHVAQTKPAVHQIVIAGGNGERLVEIWPNPTSCGVSVVTAPTQVAVLNFDDLNELIAALSQILTQQGADLDALSGSDLDAVIDRGRVGNAIDDGPFDPCGFGLGLQ